MHHGTYRKSGSTNPLYVPHTENSILGAGDKLEGMVERPPRVPSIKPVGMKGGGDFEEVTEIRKPQTAVSLTGTLMPPVDHPIHWTPPHPHRLSKKIRRRKGAI